MARHKEMYIISSYTKKIFANIRKIGAGFSGVITPLFDTMMVQAPADMGDTLVETHQTPIVYQPSTSKPQKKQKPRRKQRKEAEVSNDESEDEDHIPTPSSDPLPSGDDSFILNELMLFCTSLQEQRKSRSRGLKRLKKFGLGRRVKPPMEKDSLDAQEDASKQGRIIKEIDQNTKIALDDETQGKTNDDEIFRVDDLSGEEVVMETTTDVTEDEITMAQALAALKSIKSKVVEIDQNTEIALDDETQGKTNDDEIFRVDDLSGEEVVMETTTGEHEEKIIEDVSTTEPDTTAEDKGKAKMIEPEVPIKKKDQMRIDEEYARKLEAKEPEAARLSRAQQDEEANNFWDNIQAMMDADRLLAERLEVRERGEFSEVQKARLEMRKVNDFIAMDSEAQESSTKRTAKHLKSNISKKQKVDENVKPIIDDSQELKKCIEIVPDDGDEVLIEATPLSSRSPTIID
nr:hypothetical protein [Tanacetum cinerariifolium]